MWPCAAARAMGGCWVIWLKPMPSTCPVSDRSPEVTPVEFLKEVLEFTPPRSLRSVVQVCAADLEEVLLYRCLGRSLKKKKKQLIH